MYDVIFAFSIICFFSTIVTFAMRKMLMVWGGIQFEFLNSRLVLIVTFFLGVSIFVGTWRILTLLFGAKGSFFSLLFFCLALSFSELISKRKSFSSLVLNQWKKSILFLFAVFAVQGLLLVFWSQSVLVDSYSTIGSGHSPRYGNIALYIYQFDVVPIVGQNFAQSLLAVFPLYFKFMSPLLTLNIWLAVSITLLIAFCFELLKWYRMTFFDSIVICALVFFGNTALSASHVMVIDSWSPYFFNSYPDTILSIGSFLSILLLILCRSIKAASYRSLLFLIMMFFLFYSWTMMSVQNHYLLGAVSVLLILNFKDRYHVDKKLVSGILGLLFLSVLFARFSGGMLVDKKLKTEVPFGGMQSLANGGQSPIRFDFGVPGVVGSFRSWQHLIVVETPLLERFWISLRNIFWPALGMLFFWIILRKRKNDYSSEKRHFFDFCLCSAASGLLLLSFINVYGAKWELSRFMTIGYFSGLMFFGIACVALTKRLGRISQVVILAFAVGICFGPVTSVIQRFEMNFFDSPGFLAKFEAILNFKEFSH